MISIAAPHTYHLLYLAVYQAHKSDPEIWDKRHCTRVLTAIMGGRDFSWRVVGVTESALEILRSNGFRRKTGIKLQRAHIKARAQTVQELLQSQILSKEEFIEFWLKNDPVVICGPGENKEQLDNFIPIQNDKAELFRSDTISWRHKEAERDYLEALYASLGR
jgi:stalled ribosome rescue protein Dom34